MIEWSMDDIRIVGDIIAGSLLAGVLRLILMKAFIEPAAIFVGKYAYRAADKAVQGKLPDLFDSAD
jgi:hypothetical protein